MAALAAAFRRRAGGDLLQLQQQEADAAASSSSSGSRTPSPTHHGTTAAASGLLPDWPPQGAGAADGFPSSSIWRKHFRGVLRGKLFPLANIWTCALVATVLLALIFRAMQPTEGASSCLLAPRMCVDVWVCGCDMCRLQPPTDIHPQKHTQSPA